MRKPYPILSYVGDDVDLPVTVVLNVNELTGNDTNPFVNPQLKLKRFSGNLFLILQKLKFGFVFNSKTRLQCNNLNTHYFFKKIMFLNLIFFCSAQNKSSHMIQSDKRNSSSGYNSLLHGRCALL